MLWLSLGWAQEYGKVLARSDVGANDVQEALLQVHRNGRFATIEEMRQEQKEAALFQKFLEPVISVIWYSAHDIWLFYEIEYLGATLRFSGDASSRLRIQSCFRVSDCLLKIWMKSAMASLLVRGLLQERYRQKVRNTEIKRKDNVCARRYGQCGMDGSE